MTDNDSLPKVLPELTKQEKVAALRLAALAKHARDNMSLANFCVNCGQEVRGQIALDSTNTTVRFCPTHGVKLRPDGSCPLED